MNRVYCRNLIGNITLININNYHYTTNRNLFTFMGNISTNILIYKFIGTSWESLNINIPGAYNAPWSQSQRNVYNYVQMNYRHTCLIRSYLAHMRNKHKHIKGLK